jgi:hypothetical protein
LKDACTTRCSTRSFEVNFEPGRPGLILPEQSHLVEPLGPVRMQVEFYEDLPDL